MGGDQLTFTSVELPRLVQNGERDRCLADIVKHGGNIQPLQVRVRNTEGQSEINREAGHKQAVLVGALVMAPNRRQPMRQTVLSDTLGDALADLLRLIDVDARSAQD